MRVGGLGLFLGPWWGWKENREGYWLRWWEEGEVMLPWAVEKIAQVEGSHGLRSKLR
jgi:hypothetical protein